MARIIYLASCCTTASALILRNNATWFSLSSVLPDQPPRDGVPVVQVLESDGGIAYYGHAHVGGQDQLSVFDTGSFEIVLQSSCGAVDGALAEPNVPRSFYEDPCKDFWEQAKKTADEHPDDAATSDAGARPKDYTCCENSKCPFASYNPKESGANFLAVDEPQGSITYGSGTVVTKSVQDHFALKSKDGTTTIAKSNMPVRLIVNSDLKLFLVHKFTAIFGIAPGPFIDKSDTEARQSRPLYLLNMKRFLYCLHRDAQSNGLMTWNDADRSQDPEYAHVPVTGASFWSLPMADVRLKGNLPSHGQTDEVVGCSGGCGAVVDTGTTLLVVPQSLADHLTKLIETGDINDCSNLSKFPTLHFNLGGKNFSLGAESYLADAGEQSSSLAYTRVGNLDFPLLPMSAAELKIAGKDSQSVTGMCALAVHSQPCEKKTQFGPELILGMPFFRKYKVQFDVSKDIEGEVHTRESPSRFLHIAEKATPECNPEGGDKPASLENDGVTRLAKIDIWRVPRAPLKYHGSKAHDWNA